MINLFKRIRNKIFYLRLRFSTPEKVGYLLKDKFFFIGNNVTLYTTEFGAEPELISIHNNVTCAAGVRFITHDVSIYNMARYLEIPKDSVDKVGPIVLHDNCFVGAFSTIMPNVSIGKNSVVAACSVVTHCIPDNEVWGGCPAKFICTTEEYAQKIKRESEKMPWIKNRNQMSRKELVDAWQSYFHDFLH